MVFVRGYQSIQGPSFCRKNGVGELTTLLLQKRLPHRDGLREVIESTSQGRDFVSISEIEALLLSGGGSTGRVVFGAIAFSQVLNV